MSNETARDAADNRRILAGLRVLEVGRNVCVPYAGYLLAALGATVAKLVQDDDPATLCRTDEDSIYDRLNGRKQFVGAAQVAGLAVDVVIADSRDIADVPASDGLVSVLRVTPLDGPPVADSALLSALSAATWSMGEPGRAPVSMPAQTAAFIAGVVFAGATLAKVLGNEVGRQELSGLNALNAFVDQNSTSYLHSKIGWRREGRRAAGSAGIYPYGIFDCSDGEVALIGRSRGDWTKIAHSFGASDVRERYPDPFDIARHRADEVDAALQPYIDTLTKAEVMAAAEQEGVLAVPVSTLDDVLAFDNLHTERFFWDASGTFPGLPFLVNT
ncbi:MAG TPA: CoA transferase [Pseudonocardiaceae bacterium]|nr:CoA transferase [Pseudonocardiaceae bacterium]